ncbi:MAG: ADP-ribosylglycohydrolase family protein, partial [Lachnospiraceae bacterium]|nr:ADP-ribosylglycohydrolase family protein [Lachnospiraceae bacterium]
RILPVCIYYAEMVLSADAEFSDEEAIESIHTVAALTHNHLRSHIACGLYYFMVKELMKADAQVAAENANDCNDLKKKELNEILQSGLDAGFAFYEKFCKDDSWGLEQLGYYERCRNLQDFAKTEVQEIRSSGYVLHTFEAVVWCLINTADFRECLLKAVNLGDDTDTVAAIAGGLAGIFYGYGGIPAEWLDVIVKREWIEELCQ